MAAVRMASPRTDRDPAGKRLRDHDDVVTRRRLDAGATRERFGAHVGPASFRECDRDRPRHRLYLDVAVALGVERDRTADGARPHRSFDMIDLDRPGSN